MNRKCLNCNTLYKGRSDKKFCSTYCKSAYHYQISKDNENTWFNNVDRTIRKNRKILKTYNKEGKTTIRASVLKEQGFNENFYTHTWTNSRGLMYKYCFDYGFSTFTTDGVKRFTIITHQPYIERTLIV